MADNRSRADKLRDMANHPRTPPNEAAAARAKLRAMGEPAPAPKPPPAQKPAAPPPPPFDPFASFFRAGYYDRPNFGFGPETVAQAEARRRLDEEFRAEQERWNHEWTAEELNEFLRDFKYGRPTDRPPAAASAEDLGHIKVQELLRSLAVQAKALEDEADEMHRVARERAAAAFALRRKATELKMNDDRLRMAEDRAKYGTWPNREADESIHWNPAWGPDPRKR